MRLTWRTTWRMLCIVSETSHIYIPTLVILLLYSTPSTMGNSSSAPQSPLVAQPVPIGVFPSFVFQQEIVLVLKEKAFSFSGDDFSVKDVNGNVVFRFDGRALSMRQKKG